MKLSFSLLKAKNPEQLHQQRDILILLGIAFIIWLIYFLSNFNGLKHSDAMHYASVARNIITGKGMLANDVSPGQIALFKTNYFRYISASLLHPIIIVIFFLVFGINDYGVAFSSGVFHLLAAPIVYLLAREFFGRKIGIISVLLYIINLELLNYSISGLTESLFIFLLLLSFLILYKSSSPKGFLLVGLILGLSRLTRINAIIFILPFMAYIYLACNTRKITNILIFLAGFIGMSFPVIYRDYLIFNDPIFSIFHYDLMSFKYSADTRGRSLLLSDPPGLLRIIFSDLPSFIKAYINNLHRYYVLFLGITKPIIMSFFIVSIFRWYEDKKINRLKAVFLSSIIIQVLLLSVSTQPIRYFHIFIPLIIVFGIEYLIYLFERLPFKVKIHRYLVAGFLLIFLSGPFFYYLITPWYNKITINRKQEFYWVREFLAKNTSQDDLIAAERCEVMWYGDRRIISLPSSINVLEEIDKRFLPIDAIILTTEDYYILRRNQFVSESDKKFLNEWEKLVYNPPKFLADFELKAQFHDDSIMAVLYKKVKRN